MAGGGKDAWEVAGAQIDALEAAMRRLCDTHGGPPLAPVAIEHLDTGGKRLRARLAMAACAAAGSTAARAVGWAVACELFHNATLVHDDLQDGDQTRRGHPTVWVQHGMPQAVNAGDLLLLLPVLAVAELDAASEIRAQLWCAFGRHGCAVIRGQAAELAMTRDRVVTREAYMSTVVGKTSGLFELPVEGGAILAGLPFEEAAAIGAAFRPLGVLFQMQDDVLDLYGDKGRGEPGSDLREGKISALVVEQLALHPEDRSWLMSLLEAPREQTPDDGVARAIARFRDSGALKAVGERIHALAEEVRGADALCSRPALDALASRLIEKVLTPIRHVI